MDFQKIATFIEVMKQGSFTKAARTLNVDESVISRSVSLLETDLGVRLFNRTTRTIAPTDEGQAFFAHVEPLIEELARARSLLQDQGASPQGTIRITSPVSFGVLVVTPLLAKFHKQYPNIQIDYLVTDSVLNLLDERIDVAIRMGHLNDSSFVANKLMGLEYVVCASPNYLKANKAIKKPSDLANQNCLQFLLPGFGSSWRFRHQKTKSEETVSVRGHLRCSNALALKEAALDGSGVALLAHFLIKDELKTGKLNRVLSGFEATATDFGSNAWIVFASKTYLPKKTRVFIDFLKSEISNMTSDA